MVLGANMNPMLEWQARFIKTYKSRTLGKTTSIHLPPRLVLSFINFSICDFILQPVIAPIEGQNMDGENASTNGGFSINDNPSSMILSQKVTPKKRLKSQSSQEFLQLFLKIFTSYKYKWKKRKSNLSL